MGTDSNLKKDIDRSENWDKYKLQCMVDALAQMKTLEKCKNYNKYDFDEKKDLSLETFGVTHSIAKEIWTKKGLEWPYSSQQMLSKWHTTKKTFKNSAKKANKTGNSNEDKLKLMASFPTEIAMLISKNCASIDPVGLVDSSGKRKQPQLTDKTRVTRKKAKIERENKIRANTYDN